MSAASKPRPSPDWGRLTPLLAGSLASRVAMLVNAVAAPTSATSGLSSPVSFAYLTPHGSWAKMSQAYVAPMLISDDMTADSLATFCETWPKWGTLRDGVAGKLRIQVRRTSGRESSSSPLWSTATASDGSAGAVLSGAEFYLLRSGRPRKIARSGSDGSAGLAREVVLYGSMWPTPRQTATRGSRKALVENRQWSAPSLEQTVELSEGVLPREFESADELHGSAYALWHTPRAIYGDHPGMKDLSHLTGQAQALWPTPRGEGHDAGGHHGQPDSLWQAMRLWATPRNSDANGVGVHGDGGMDLRTQAALWSTPAAQDGKNATLPPSLARRDTLVGDVMRNWATPRATEAKSRSTKPSLKRGQHPGRTVMEDIAQPGALNADWVEILQGFPVGWTDLDCAAPTPWQGWPSLPHEPQHAYEPPRTLPKGKAKHRNQRLKALGNAVVCFQAAPLFCAISAVEGH